MHRLIAIVSLLGFTLALVVHIAALLGIDVAEYFPSVWGLHIGVFIVFIPFILHSRKNLGIRISLAQIRQRFPGWVVALGMGLFLYTTINFILFIRATQGGSPSIHDGKFILQQHGHLIRELTAGEYTAFKANEVRGLSGHWLFFYFVPFSYFMFTKIKQPT